MQPKKPSNESQDFNFLKLSKDMREYTSQFFSSSDFKNLSLVSKEFHRLSHGRLFWEKTVKKHFPNKEIKPEINLDWATLMQKLEKEQYGGTANRSATIIYLIKEGDAEKLRKMNLTVTELWILDKALHQYVLSIHDLIDNQNILNLFYEIAQQWFDENKGKHSIAGIVDEYGSTLLTWAIWCKQPLDEIENLILAGAEVNQYGRGDYGSIYAAAQVGYVQCMPLLLQHGGNVNEGCGMHLQTAHEIATLNGRTDCMNYLRDHGALLRMPRTV